MFTVLRVVTYFLMRVFPLYFPLLEVEKSKLGLQTLLKGIIRTQFSQGAKLGIHTAEKPAAWSGRGNGQVRASAQVWLIILPCQSFNFFSPNFTKCPNSTYYWTFIQNLTLPWRNRSKEVIMDTWMRAWMEEMEGGEKDGRLSALVESSTEVEGCVWLLTLPFATWVRLGGLLNLKQPSPLSCETWI